MLVTLTHAIIVNDGKRGVPRRKGETVEVDKQTARLLFINNQAEEVKKKAA